jgi:three-Cys-motif partner protein
MTAPRTTVWKLDPHTAAKHEILRRYLEAWTAILGSGFPQVVYVDGFAGPGRYDGGEDGSPIIALKAALAQSSRIAGQVLFLFVEEKLDRAEFLKSLIAELRLPPNFVVEIAGGCSFEEAFRGFYRAHIAQRGKLPPTFAFIDPFGWKGVPFSLVEEILAQSSCEVLVTFMYEEINRFIDHPQQRENFASFFGSTEWTEVSRLTGAADRSRFLHGLYLRQLQRRAKYVRSFQMRNATNSIDYYLFYATRNILGLKKMKEAMWKVDRTGGFTFSDATDPGQGTLFQDPRFEVLFQKIISHFKGQEVTVGQIEHFVVAETAFRETHYKKILKDLELANPPRLRILSDAPSRRRGTFSSPALRIRIE